MTRRPTAHPVPEGGRRAHAGALPNLQAFLWLLFVPALACAPGERSASSTGSTGVDASAPALGTDERAGEEVYRREGCERCHTQRDAAPPNGPVDLPGPPEAALIASRVGPDLGLEGHRRSDDWHLAHLYAPDVLAPGSRMPASRHLFRAIPSGRPLPSEDALHLVAYLQGLGRARRDVWAEFRSREPPIPAPEAGRASDRLERGTRLYEAHCAPCHGVAGDGRGPAASLLLFPPRDFTAGHYRFRSGPASEPPRDADLFRSVTLGTGIGSAMPGFFFLPAEDRWALVLRLKEFSPALRGRGLDSAAVAGGSPPGGPSGAAPGPEIGRDLYARLECAACHGPEGRGLTREEARAQWADPEGVAVPRSGDLTHACSRRGGGSDEAFAHALQFGVGSPMPSFSDDLERPLDAARSLIRYLDPGQGHPR